MIKAWLSHPAASLTCYFLAAGQDLNLRPLGYEQAHSDTGPVRRPRGRKAGLARRGQPRQSLSSAANRLVDEALRTSERAVITFRPGPTGRRAGLASGPDVWEV